MTGIRPTRRPRATRAPAERPAQILAAAASLLLRDGLNVTIEAIAAEAGLGKGTVYEYFGSKAEIFTAMRAWYNDQILAAGANAVLESPDAPAFEKVRRFIAGMVEFGAANAELVSLLFHEASIEEDNELAAIEAKLLDLVQEGVDSGELIVADPAFSVEFLLHGLHGIMETSLAQGQPAKQVLERIDRVLTALLNPVEPRLL